MLKEDTVRARFCVSLSNRCTAVNGNLGGVFLDWASGGSAR